MLIKRGQESAHWYLPSGKAFYEVPKKDGTGMRNATIRDAIKAGAYRSVTNVLSVLGKPGLVKWQIEQAILAALTLPRLPGEEEHRYAERIIQDSESQARVAAERGTLLHDAASNFLTQGVLPADENVARFIRPFVDWCNTNVVSCIASEIVVVNHDHFYAGKLDIACRMRSGKNAIIDIKTQEVKLNETKKNLGQPDPAFYDEWAMQLAAYSGCDLLTADEDFPADSTDWQLISLVVDRTGMGPFDPLRDFRVGCYPKIWENRAIALDAFHAACRVWGYSKGSVPGNPRNSAVEV